MVGLSTGDHLHVGPARVAGDIATCSGGEGRGLVISGLCQ
jgi:hypothetical protein